MTHNGTFFNPLLMAPLHFGWLDYSFFGLLLAVSVVVGTWFGICGKKHNTSAVDYLMGGKSMSIFPIGVSLASSHISGVTIMGAPAELYLYGAHYGLIGIAGIIMGIIVNYIYLPVFYELQLTSTYEYLEKRFNSATRKMSSFLFAFSALTFFPICIYLPSLAFSQVSGLSVHIISPVVCFFCIFYTMMGGLKGVVWTDFLQGFVTIGALFAVVGIGIFEVGGFGALWERNLESGRLDVSFDPNPFVRSTFWTVTIGASISWLGSTGVSQGTMQKFMSLPTITHARWALLLFVILVIILKGISCFAGLLIYAAYHDCDPVKSKAINKVDQLLPYFVMDTARNIPGLPGLFVAGVFSAALSTMSSALNSLAATIYEDFISPRLSGKLSDEKINIILKSIVIVIGGVSIAMIFVVEKLGAILEVAYSLTGITLPPLLGLFTMGMLVPWVNTKGALTGSAASMAFMGWVVFGSQHAAATGQMKHPRMPTSVAGCGFNVTDVTTETLLPDTGDVLLIYRLSYLYYTVLGLIIMSIVALIVSFATGARKLEDSDPRLFAPFVRNWMEKKIRASAGPAEKELLNMQAVH